MSPSASGQSIHHAAATGFGAKAATYASGRPDYPQAIVDWLRASAGVTPGTTVLDLGAGTGKFTPNLIAAGATVIVVEPVDAMRQALSEKLPDIDARAGTAEAIPLADRSVDTVVCAQAFHWFASARALAEIARVLRPGGRLALIWNVRDESVAWVRALTDIMTPHEGDAPRYHTGQWRDAFADGPFGPLVETVLPHVHRGSAETVIIDRTMSVSFIAALPPDEQARVRADLDALIAATPELSGQAEVSFPYATSAFVATKNA
jgi:SAM-dependent methyltransferase